MKINPLLIPEFPIKKALLPSYRDEGHKSIKVDYLALEKCEPAEPAKRAFLVELKTDMGSRNREQDKDLRDAVDLGLKALVEGVVDIARATNERRKYGHLLYSLSCLHLIECENALFPVSKPALEKIEYNIDERRPLLELVYIQPEFPTNIIDFNKFAETVEKGGSEVGHAFAQYLKKWACEDAGSPNPKDWRSC